MQVGEFNFQLNDDRVFTDALKNDLAAFRGRRGIQVLFPWQGLIATSNAIWSEVRRKIGDAMLPGAALTGIKQFIPRRSR